MILQYIFPRGHLWPQVWSINRDGHMQTPCPIPNKHHMKFTEPWGQNHTFSQLSSVLDLISSAGPELQSELRFFVKLGACKIAAFPFFLHSGWCLPCVGDGASWPVLAFKIGSVFTPQTLALRYPKIWPWLACPCVLHSGLCAAELPTGETTGVVLQGSLDHS